jgi:hypothetical protein
MRITNFKSNYVFTNPDGTLTHEAYTMLEGWFSRIGKFNGMSAEDAALLASFVSSPTTDGALPEIEMPAIVTETSKQLSEVIHKVDSLTDQTAKLSEIVKYAQEFETSYSFVNTTFTDWERPGRIGYATPNSGAFTTLTASGAITLSPANANVVLSPTGSGSVTIAPNASSAMDNVDIGVTTPKTVKATTMTTTGAFNLFNGLLRSSGTTDIQFKGSSTLANAEAFFENTDTKLIIHASSSSGVAKTLELISNGGAGAQFSVSTAGTITSGTSTITGAFGCNSKAAQTAYAVGAASTDLATVITLANNLRLALIANGIAS